MCADNPEVDRVYVYTKETRMLTVPKYSPYVKEFYVKEALRVLDEEGTDP